MTRIAAALALALLTMPAIGADIAGPARRGPRGTSRPLNLTVWNVQAGAEFVN